MATRAEQQEAKAQRECDEWNAKHPVGTRVRYWKLLRGGAPTGVGPTKHEATVLGGHTAVAWIEGCVGCVALTHVEAEVV